MARDALGGEAGAHDGFLLLADEAQRGAAGAEAALGDPVTELGGAQRDRFLAAAHHYFAERGLTAAALTRFLNALTLAFTVAFTALLLLYIDWGAIVSERAFDACTQMAAARAAAAHAGATAPVCDVVSLGYVHPAPLRRLSPAMAALAVAYLCAIGAYVLWSARHFAGEVRTLLRIRGFFLHNLGLADVALEQGRVTWANVLRRLVQVHRSHAARTGAPQLSELDVVNMLMRKDNFLIALVNGGALPTCGLDECLRGVGARIKASWRSVALAPLARRSAAADALGVHSDDAIDGMELLLAETASAAAADAPAPVEGDVASSGASSSGSGAEAPLRPPLARPSVFLSKALTWNLYWCLLDPMFDDATMRIKPGFLRDVDGLRKRFQYAALLNLCVAPFTVASLFLHYAMKHAEHFYRSPNAIVDHRGWSEVATWKFRLYNEVGHIFARRCARAHKPASEYVRQFPSPLMAIAMKFVSFVVGSFAALLIVLTFIDDSILEVHLFGRTMLWYAAVFGVVLTISRSLSGDEDVYLNPAKKLAEVIRHTYYAPASWVSAAAGGTAAGAGDSMGGAAIGQFDDAHSRTVLAEFERFFKFKAVLFVEELAGVVVAPFLLYYVLPEMAEDVLGFLRNHIAHTEHIGDICSYAAFDLRRHGNPYYGSPVAGIGPPKNDCVSFLGKMEKSIVAFYTYHPLPEVHASSDTNERLCADLVDGVRSRRGSDGAEDGRAPRTSRGGQDAAEGTTEAEVNEMLSSLVLSVHCTLESAV